MITVIEGKMGTGKTLVLAKLAKADIDRGKRRVYAKAPFAFNGWEEFDLVDFSKVEKMGPCSIYLDGVDDLLEARLTSTKVNTLMTYLATRKGIDLCLTTVDVDRLDKRVRRNIGLRILCSGLVEGKLDLSLEEKSSGKSYSSSLEAETLFPLVTGSAKLPVEEDPGIKFVLDALEMEE